MSIHTNQTKNVLRKHKILKKLRNNNNILITKPDKGNGVVVVVDRIYYISSMCEIVNDTSKFFKLRSEPIISRENKLQIFLRNLKNKCFSPKMFMTTYILVGSNRLGYMVFPRHKNLNVRQITFRPIDPSIGTYNYKLVKLVGGLLNLIIPSKHCVTDSSLLAKK